MTRTLSDILEKGEECLLDNVPEGSDKPGAAEIVGNKEGQPVVVQQHIHYQYRGEYLKDFCMYDYAGCIKIVKCFSKNKKCKSDDATKDRTNPGPPANQIFKFAVGHPLQKTPEQ